MVHDCEIEKIVREDEVVKISTSDGCMTTYDFLAVTSNLKDALEFLDVDVEERELLGGLKVQANLTTTLVSVNHTTDPVAISSWTSSLDPKNKMRLMTVRDSYKIFFPQDFGKVDKDYLLCYQYEPESWEGSDEHKRVLEEVLCKDLGEAGYEDVVVEEQHIWPYFQRWDQEGLNDNCPVRLMRRQGMRRTWFAGASTLFESVHDCMEFNKVLVSMISAKDFE